ncbi:CU044_5270 family protein [Planotetraspora kaengkrachanensis]|uniref:CU044_5270 family protein n=1 Tax=Planotetraspora kaengkrachanensis TaxID=575193 RepID=A0A8J3PUL6_9ACTN|nr:CU044_5270 family protein [Planotetraspora kaengkrachanensis]GIG81376.1 hypothetical protein Pka01_45030 [Planotetraspora kaengkrachanensis]
MPNPPRSPHLEHDMTDHLVTRLRPAQLDDLADDAYGRRRSADLARAFETPRTQLPTRRITLSQRRRPLFLIAGTAVAGLAAAAIIVPGMVSGDTVSGDGRSTTPVAAAPSPSATRLDAHSVLLAAAATAAREPATTGRYWYTLERETSRVDRIVTKPGSGKSPKVKMLPFTASVSTSQESWLARSPKDRSRTITGIDFKTAFDSPADEAKWKEMGAPPLTLHTGGSTKPRVNNYDMALNFMIGQQQLSMAELAKLPTTKDGLEKELKRRYQADVNDPKYPLKGSFLQYVWSTAQDLLAGPVTPGTRAALYRVLADQPGLTVAGKVTDPFGRPGIAIEMTLKGNSERESFRLIVDPDTGRLLAYQAAFGEGEKPLLTMAYKSMGWTDSLGARP